MADIKKSVNLLPEHLRTDKNSKFLSSTIDQLIQTPQVERLDGFVGSKITPNYNPTTDFYLDETSTLRNNYSLEPALVFRDANTNITDVVSYDDLINEVGIQGGKNSNLNSLFSSKFYSYDPLIDWDKLINYTDYYWLPTGPDLITLADTEVVNDILGNTSYVMDNGYSLSNGMKISVEGNIYLVEGVGLSIKLIEYRLLDSYDRTATVFDETFDGVQFDEYPFDGDKKLPLTPDYTTINRASLDLNPWTRYNRWFHKDIIKSTSEINNIPVIYPLSARAKRPIIEFKPNLQLYNFGKIGIRNVDLIDNSTTDAFDTVDGTIGYYVDGTLLQQGHRIIFNVDNDLDVRGKIFQVDFDLTGEVPILRLIGAEDLTPTDMDSVSVNLGIDYYGTSWYFNSSTSKWIYAQQHVKLNQPPLFNLFTNTGVSYTDIDEANNFTGNQIFGYEVGTGPADAVLGFPLKYQNNIGAGSYLFKNYFMTDSITVISNNLSSTISTAVTFLKLNNNLVNVWADAVDYQIPVLEVQTVSEDTSTIILTCFDSPIDTSLSISVYVNNIKIPVTVQATTSKVVLTTENTLLKDDVVLLKIETDQVPNGNGYYETPISLTNNPLNGSAADLTLSELGDHLATMIAKTSAYTGNNLRDLTDYAKYGSRLVVNAEPISFAQIFLGKKEHNVVDAIRQAGEHYDQFKMNFLRAIQGVDSELSAADALDLVLTTLNKAKDLKSSYQRSDMLGFGQNKTVRTFTVADAFNVEYPVGFEFDLTRLSFQSVLVYFNGTQLIHNLDYTFNYIDGSVTILAPIVVGDVIDIVCYSNTLGAYIPPTPTKLGLYPAYQPRLFDDVSNANGSVSTIACHDGSAIVAYGDYRDAIILEFELRIYNNIKVQYNRDIFDIMAVTPGAYRTKTYTESDVDSILINDFSRWAGKYGVDAITNSTFDEGNPLTWNYTGCLERTDKTPVTGSWRNLFKYFYDTIRPNVVPWRMLGFSDQPLWWEDEYGFGPYTSTNTKMWTDLRDGYVRGEDRYLLDYARPNLFSIIPVDSLGNLKIPNEFLVTENSYQDKKSNWKFGDAGPAEHAWSRSSQYRFSIVAASALLNPCIFCSTLYDVSRTTVNATGQITYKEDDLYLDPRKLMIEGEDNNQIAGFGTYVIEVGRQKDQYYITKLRQDLNYLNVNLFHKVGGFVSKEKIQIIIDSIDPTSTSPGVVLPSEDYSLILNVSNPIKSARISGIIVQRSNGNFIIKGYDIRNPYFEILRPVVSLSSGVVKVGGVSEEFTDWSNIINNGNNGLSSVDKTSAESATGRYYKQGQLVRYNNKFYRVKTGHNAGSAFDTALFQGLPELPVKGGAIVQAPARFETTTTQIPYGTEFSTVQEVYDVILGYGAYLETQGFIFDEFNADLNEILNWKFTGKEFLYWTTQNWADGNLVTLSPFANYIKYNLPNSVVDNIAGTKYEYSLLKADGKPYPIDRFTMAREDTVCTIKTTDANEGLFFATLNSVQKEHAMVFNNFTVFNDTIYDIETGYKQRRIKLSGFRTKNWNGDLFSPGFVFDNVEINDWQAYKKYLPGKVVRYNGRYYESLVTISADATFDFTKWDQLRDKPVSQLLPNFDYKINQFEDFYSLDIDNFDYNQQQLAQHLTGYTPRTYLNNIFTNPISQYKFYQGLIKDKGTKNAVDKLSKASEFTNKGEISFKEEWAFRVGHYGSFETLNEIEFPLEEGTYLENPYIVKFVDLVPTDANPLINYITSSTLLLTPVDYSPASTIGSYASTWADNNLKLTTAGYVRADDVTSTAYNKNSLLDIANNSAIKDGDTIWLGFQENGDWTVYRYTKQLAEITGVFVSAPGSEITFVTDSHHNLQAGDVISVVRFNAQVNGVYIVNSIENTNQFKVSTALSSIDNEELLNYGSLYRFEEARYNSLNDLAQVSDLLKLNAGDKVWIDEGTGGKWQVYEKIKNYSAGVSDTVNTPAGQKFGSSIFASDDSPVMLVSAPGWRIDGTFNWGRVKVFNKVNNKWTRKYDYILNSSQKTYCSSTSSTQFGYSLQYDIAKKLYVTGAPEATYVRATGTNVLTLSTGTGYARPYVNEGLVKIDSRQEDFPTFTEIVLVNPYPANNSRFGHSIYVDQVSATSSSTMLISAPGTTTFSGTGSVYAYCITTSSTVMIHPHGINVSSTSSVSLSAGDQWGYKIAGCSIGFAISAPGYSDDTGIVQLFNPNLSYSQTVVSPFGTKGRFGQDIAVSNSGDYLLISAPEIKDTNEPYGKVAIYKNNTGLYVLDQIINNPLPTNDLKFGYSISISKDEKTIGISALGKTRSREQVFDEYNNSGKTTFDGSSTKFNESIPDAGTVYIYNKIGDKFIQAEELNDVRIVEDVVVTSTIPFDVPTQQPTAPVISNITLSEDPTNIGNTIVVTFHTDVDISYFVAAVDGTDNGPYGGTIQNSPNRDHYFFVETSRLSAGIRNLVIYAKNSSTGVVGEGYITFTLEPAIYTISAGSRYGSAIVVTNNEVFVGAPTNQSNSLPPPATDESRLFIFDKINTNSQSWKVLREQADTVDVSTIGRVALIDTLKEEIIDYLDVVDPVKGKIAGIAEQELKFKAAFDPATYSIGLAGTIVNTETNWLDEHVGELWWDLSTAKFMWYEQGDDIFRKNNWGKLFPGASIDVYEWVKSDLLPSEWAAQADTTKGLVNSISGQPKYPDNSVISVKQLFNNVTGSFENVYYFWVKNKVTLPGVKNRRLSSYQVSSYIADPVGNGLKFVEILSPNSVAFANVQPSLIGNRINANITTDYNATTSKHTEWLLLNEGDHTSVPNTLLEKKLFDSLLGHDSLGNNVPGKNLTYRNRYGIGIRPQQTLFKNRLLALRNLISFVNSVLLENRIVGNYSFENLNKVEEIPAMLSYEYDAIVEDTAALDEVFTINFVRAELECFAENGKIKSVIITNPGFGYSVPPKVSILSTSESAGEIATELDEQGRVISARIINAGLGYLDGGVTVTVRAHAIIVQVNSNYGNKWTKHSFDYSLRTWIKSQTQKYNTPLFWKTVDWVATSYDSYKTIEYTISDLFALGSLTTIANGDYVKVKNIGDGKYAILQKVSSMGNYIPSYNIVYREQGTIQLLDSLWDYGIGKYAYDIATIEETLYDQIPDFELYYILTALKNNIFINSLKVNWNLFFFAAVKYALTEQKLLDWAFKTSFINVFNNIGTLNQRPVYKLNNEEYFENYINEIKPYHTKIRSYTSAYDKLEQSNLYTTDFDLPSYYNTITDALSIVDLDNSLMDAYPRKSWKDNYKLHVGAIEVGYSGSGYTERPTVVISPAEGDLGTGATAEAYIRNGKVYRVIVTNPGSGYTMTPLVTIEGGGNVTDIARASVITANNTVRKNIIGMKFDRTSTVGDLVDLTVTDEFLCDGTADKFTLTWLASPDKRTITPLLDGKLIFGADYTIEYYQVKVSHTGINIPQAFPRTSWEGETMVDHRYKYFLNTDQPNSVPGSIRQYAKFIFLNQVPKYGQVFKIAYKKNIDLYNAIDRINSLYDPTDLMPGKELPLLMSGTEYSGVNVQGLMLNQTPPWDSGVPYDSAPWGDYLSSYATSKILYDVYRGDRTIFLSSTDGVQVGQIIRVADTSTTRLLRSDARVIAVTGNSVDVESLDRSDTNIIHASATSTEVGSMITIVVDQSFNDTLTTGDYIWVHGVRSIGGRGIESVTPDPLNLPVSTQTITVIIAAPDFSPGIQATATPIKVGNTVTSVVMTNYGMGYRHVPLVTFTGTNMTNQGSGYASLDPGYNQRVPISTCTSNVVQFKSLWTLSSITTVIDVPNAYFEVVTVDPTVPVISSSTKLLEKVTKTVTNTDVGVVETFAPIYDVARVLVTLSTTSTEVVSTTTWTNNTLWYSVTNSNDGNNRAIVSLRDVTTGSTITGDITVTLYGRTEIEFYAHNTDYNSLDSSVTGSDILNTSLVGYKPEDIIIDGNNFLNAVDSYAPEECVPGHVRDALGINVYTAATPSSPLIITGEFGAGPTEGGQLTYAKLTWLPDNPLGFIVHADGRTFDRVQGTSFSSSTQYSLVDDTIVVPSQPKNIRVGYSFVTAGSNVIVDSAYASAIPDTDSNTGTIMVSSLLSIDEVHSVHVLVNGVGCGETTTSTSYGYMLTPVSSINNRAAVTIYALGHSVQTVQVWFFNHPYPIFNTLSDQFFTIGSTATSRLNLNRAPATIEPVSEQVIVEKITPTGRYRMLPPWASYYKVSGSLRTYAIDTKNPRANTYSLDNVKVYLNGIELTPGYDFTVNGLTETITLITSIIVDGDAIAVLPLVDYDYVVLGDVIHFASPMTTATIKVTSFTDHDNMMIRTERFDGKYRRQFVLTFPAVSDNYVWLTIGNKALNAGYDYKLLPDLKTIELSEFIDVGQIDDVVVTVVNPPSYGSTILGYRLFTDMFGRHHYHRLSEYFTTKLTEPLQYTDDKIFVEDGDHLLQPNPGLNIPGVVFIDSERIEYTAKDGNVLSGLRRSTLGTGPAKFSDINTKVIDQSARQTIPTVDYNLIQYIPSSTSTSYVISAVTNTSTFSINTTTHAGSGITFSTLTNAVDQIEVYYGGRQLRKSSLQVHNKNVSYYDTVESTETLPPEFSINISTPGTVPVIIDVNGGTPPTGSGWVLPETTATMQIQPGWIMQDATGARYTVIYSGHNSLFNGWGVGFANAITIAWPLTFIEPIVQQMTLNIAEEITTGTRITIVKREAEFWTDTTSTSLLESTGIQATFLRNRPAELPDVYFYGGEKVLLENSLALTDENGEPFEGY